MFMEVIGSPAVTRLAEKDFVSQSIRLGRRCRFPNAIVHTQLSFQGLYSFLQHSHLGLRLSELLFDDGHDGC